MESGVPLLCFSAARLSQPSLTTTRIFPPSFEAPATRSRTLSPSLSFIAFPIAHGPNPSSGASTADPSSSSSRSATQKATTTTTTTGKGSLEKEVYCSTAVFVKDEETEREFLFFGDVEPGASPSHCESLESHTGLKISFYLEIASR